MKLFWTNYHLMTSCGGGHHHRRFSAVSYFSMVCLLLLLVVNYSSALPTIRSTPSSSSPPSQIESVVANAKSLLPNNQNKLKTAKKWENDDDDNSFLRATAAGLAVSLAMVPEAIAFSFVAGVNPLVGLWTTVVLGFTAASLGGRAGICSSASGACSVVVATLCQQYDPQYLPACAILAGFFQILTGVFQLGKFIRLVPHPVMLGFVNGLAIVMFKAQLIHFRDLATAPATMNGGARFFNPFTFRGASVYGVTALTMVLVKVLPLWPVTKMIPPSLGAMLVSSVVTKMTKLPIQTLADVAGASTFVGGRSVVRLD